MGVRKIIAVNVTPSREDMLKEYDKIKEDKASAGVPAKRGWFNLRQYFREKLKANILNIIFGKFHARF